MTDSGNPEVQSAVHSSQNPCGDVLPGHSFEKSGGSAESAQSAPVDARGVAASLAAPVIAWGRVLTPPDLWSADRPALKAVWAYADRAAWTTPDGSVRWAGRAYAWLAIALTAVLYGLAWVVERPSRLAVAAVLVVLAGQVPPLSWLI